MVKPVAARMNDQPPPLWSFLDIRLLTLLRRQLNSSRGDQISVTDGILMLLQDLAVIDSVQHKMFPAPEAHKRHGKGVSFGLGELEIIGDPWIAGRAVARVTSLRDSVSEVGFLKEDYQLFGFVLDVHVPICGEVRCIVGRV